jgi:arginyl-tRNA synthetase
MIREIVKENLTNAAEKAGYKGIDPEVHSTTDKKFGDYYSTIALKLAKLDPQRKPVQIAKSLVAKFGKKEDVFTASIAPNSFLNFKLADKYLQSQVRKIIEAGVEFGHVKTGKDKKARVEFISANPTGPLHIGNARGGPLGDTIANVLQFAGYKVLREYINNDRGNQVTELGKTLASKAGLIKAKDEELTYKGEYTEDLALKVKDKLGGVKDLSKEKIIEKAGEIGTDLMYKEIISDTSDIGIKFDKVYHESELQRKLKPILKELETKGLLETHEDDCSGWFSPPDKSLGDEGAVVKKSDGSYTYFATDIVYHKEKIESGYDLVVDVFGSNTSGHVPKIKALREALRRFTKSESELKFVLYQFVRVKKGNEVVRMSKRAGNFVTAREVLDEVGRDAFRFTMLLYDPNTHMDFDLEQAKKQSEENPVYYVQYAHARCSSILKKAKKEGFDLGNLNNSKINLLKTNPELSLIRKLVKFPELVKDISDPSKPNPFPVHLLALNTLRVADELNKFYEQVRVIGEEKEVTEARLALIVATKIVLGNSLKLMGISAPEHMEKIENESKTP